MWLIKSNHSTLVQLPSTSTMTIFNQPPPWLVHHKWRRRGLETHQVCSFLLHFFSTNYLQLDYFYGASHRKWQRWGWRHWCIFSPRYVFFYSVFFQFFSTNYLQLDYVYGTWNDNKVTTITITTTNTWNVEQGLKMASTAATQTG